MNILSKEEFQKAYNQSVSSGNSHEGTINQLIDSSRNSKAYAQQFYATTNPAKTLSKDEFANQYNAARSQGVSGQQAVADLSSGKSFLNEAVNSTDDAIKGLESFRTSKKDVVADNRAKREKGDDNRKTTAEIYAERAKKDVQRIENILDDSKEKDNFFGKFAANRKAGRLSQESGKAWYQAMKTGSDEDRKYAEAVDVASQAYNQKNQGVVGEGNLLSKDLAQYIPQFVDQTGGRITGMAIGGGIGALATGGAGTAAGINVGGLIGGNINSFQEMAGGAYSTLRQSGVNHETAKAAATQEAIVSSLIESGEDALGMFLTGTGKIAGKVLESLGKEIGEKAAKEIAEEVSKGTLRKFFEGLGKYGLNAGSEGFEEAIQECVSIANERRVAKGGDMSFVGLLAETLDVAGEMAAGSLRTGFGLLGESASEDVNRVNEAFGGGARLGLVTGGIKTGGAYLANRMFGSPATAPAQAQETPAQETAPQANQDMAQMLQNELNSYANSDNEMRTQKSQEAYSRYATTTLSRAYTDSVLTDGDGNIFARVLSADSNGYVIAVKTANGESPVIIPIINNGNSGFFDILTEGGIQLQNYFDSGYKFVDEAEIEAINNARAAEQNAEEQAPYIDELNEAQQPITNQQGMADALNEISMQQDEEQRNDYLDALAASEEPARPRASQYFEPIIEQAVAKNAPQKQAQNAPQSAPVTAPKNARETTQENAQAANDEFNSKVDGNATDTSAERLAEIQKQYREGKISQKKYIELMREWNLNRFKEKIAGKTFPDESTVEFRNSTNVQEDNTNQPSGDVIKTEETQTVDAPSKDSEGNDLAPSVKRFFAKSKVRDKFGRLLRLYHGSKNNSTTFDPDVGLGGGFWLSSDPKFANYYANGTDDNPADIKSLTELQYLDYDELDPSYLADVQTDLFVTGIDLINEYKDRHSQTTENTVKEINTKYKSAFDKLDDQLATAIKQVSRLSLEEFDDQINDISWWYLTRIADIMQYDSADFITTAAASRLEHDIRNAIKPLGDTPSIVPMYANIENPLEIDANGSKWNEIELSAEEAEQLGLISRIPNGDVMVKKELGDYGYYQEEDKPSYKFRTYVIAEAAKANGFDGLILNNVGNRGSKGDITESEYVVFNPSQVKDAENKNPTSNPDFRYKKLSDEEIQAKLEKLNNFTGTESPRQFFTETDKNTARGLLRQWFDYYGMKGDPDNAADREKVLAMITGIGEDTGKMASSKTVNDTAQYTKLKKQIADYESQIKELQQKEEQDGDTKTEILFIKNKIADAKDKINTLTRKLDAAGVNVEALANGDEENIQRPTEAMKLSLGDERSIMFALAALSDNQKVSTIAENSLENQFVDATKEFAENPKEEKQTRKGSAELYEPETTAETDTWFDDHVDSGEKAVADFDMNIKPYDKRAVVDKNTYLGNAWKFKYKGKTYVYSSGGNVINEQTKERSPEYFRNILPKKVIGTLKKVYDKYQKRLNFLDSKITEMQERYTTARGNGLNNNASAHAEQLINYRNEKAKLEKTLALFDDSSYTLNKAVTGKEFPIDVKAALAGIDAQVYGNISLKGIKTAISQEYVKKMIDGENDYAKNYGISSQSQGFPTVQGLSGGAGLRGENNQGTRSGTADAGQQAEQRTQVYGSSENGNNSISERGTVRQAGSGGNVGRVRTWGDSAKGKIASLVKLIPTKKVASEVVNLAKKEGLSAVEYSAKKSVVIYDEIPANNSELSGRLKNKTNARQDIQVVYCKDRIAVVNSSDGKLRYAAGLYIQKDGKTTILAVDQQTAAHESVHEDISKIVKNMSEDEEKAFYANIDSALSAILPNYPAIKSFVENTLHYSQEESAEEILAEVAGVIDSGEKSLWGDLINNAAESAAKNNNFLSFINSIYDSADNGTPLDLSRQFSKSSTNLSNSAIESELMEKFGKPLGPREDISIKGHTNKTSEIASKTEEKLNRPTENKALSLNGAGVPANEEDIENGLRSIESVQSSPKSFVKKEDTVKFKNIASDTAPHGGLSVNGAETQFKQLDNVTKKASDAFDAAAERIEKSRSAYDKNEEFVAFKDSVAKVMSGETSFADFHKSYKALEKSDTMKAYHDRTVEGMLDMAQYLREKAETKATAQNIAAFQEQAATAMQALAHHIDTVNTVVKDDLSQATKLVTKNKAKNPDDRSIKGYVLGISKRWQFLDHTMFKSWGGFDEKSRNFFYRLASESERAHANEAKNRIHLKSFFNEISKDKSKAMKALLTGDAKTGIKVNTENGEYELSWLDAMSLVDSVETHGLKESESIKSVVFTNAGDKNSKGGKLKFEDGETIIGLYNQIKKAMDGNNEVRTLKAAATEMFADAWPQLANAYRRNTGVELGKRESYFPLAWASDKQDEKPADFVRSLDTAALHRRTRTENGSLLVRPYTEVIDKYIGSVSSYMAYSELGKKLEIMQNGAFDAQGLSAALKDNFGQQDSEWYNEYTRSINNYEAEEDTYGINKFARRLRNNFAQGALLFSVTTPMKQVTALPTIQGVVSPMALRQAMLFHRDGIYNYKEVVKQNPLYAAIRMGGIDPEIAEFMNSDALSKAKRKSGIVSTMANLNAIVDSKDSEIIFKACALDVKMNNPGVKVGSELFNTLVENKFQEAVVNINPVYNTKARAEMGRTPNELVRFATMFRTQQTQMLNRLVTAYGEYKTAVKNGTDGDIKAKKETLTQTVKGQAEAAVFLAAVQLAADMLLHKRRKYDSDDDDEADAEGIIKRMVSETTKNVASTVLGGQEIAGRVLDLMFANDEYSKEASGINLGPIDTMFKFLDSIQTLRLDFTRDEIKKGTYGNALSDARYMISNGAMMLGIPANSVYNIVNAIVMTAKDIAGNNDSRYDDMARYADNARKDFGNKLLTAYLNGNEAKAFKYIDLAGDRLTTHLNNTVLAQIRKGEYSDETVAGYLLAYGNYDNEAEAMEAVRKAHLEAETGIKYTNIASEYKKGNITKEQALSYWQAYGGLTEEAAQKKLREADYNIETGLKYNEMYADFVKNKISEDEYRAELMKAAADDVLDPTAEINLKIAQAKYEKQTGVHYDTIGEDYRSGKITADQLLNARMAIKGETRDEARLYLETQNFKKKFNVNYTDMKKLYRQGKISSADAIAWRMKAGGASQTSAESWVKAQNIFLDTGYEPDGKYISTYYDSYATNATIGTNTFYDKYINEFASHSGFGKVFNALNDPAQSAKSEYATSYGAVSPKQTGVIDILNANIADGTISYSLAKKIWTEYCGYKGSSQAFRFVG